MNSIGKKFNKLTIISKADSYITLSGKSLSRFNCLCDCGNNKIATYKYLKRGDIKSCGCISTPKIDIEKENTYGDLTIIKELDTYLAKDGEKERVVLCKCKCGNQKEYKLSYLRSGKVIDCGCIYKSSLKPKKELKSIPESDVNEQWKPFNEYLISDKGKAFYIKSRSYLSDKRFSIKIGGVVFNIHDIVYRLFKDNYDPLLYKIIFVDSNKYNRSIDNLFLGRITYCGKITWIDRLYNNMRTAGTNSTKNRKKYLTFPKSYLIEQFIKQGGKSAFLKLDMDLTCKDKLLSISVDRIDNTKDYEKDNITLVTRFENMGRGSEDFNIFKSFCDKIKSSQ